MVVFKFMWNRWVFLTDSFLWFSCIQEENSYCCRHGKARAGVDQGQRTTNWEHSTRGSSLEGVRTRFDCWPRQVLEFGYPHPSQGWRYHGTNLCHPCCYCQVNRCLPRQVCWRRIQEQPSKDFDGIWQNSFGQWSSSLWTQEVRRSQCSCPIPKIVPLEAFSNTRKLYSARLAELQFRLHGLSDELNDERYETSSPSESAKQNGFKSIEAEWSTTNAKNWYMRFRLT